MRTVVLRSLHTSVTSAFTLLVLLVLAAFTPERASAQTTGVLTVLWGDPAPGSNAPSKIEVWLNEDNGRMTKVVAADAVFVNAGGIEALNNTRVTISGTRTPAAALRTESDQITAFAISPTRRLVSKGSSVSNLLARGSQPFITILCKFADVLTEPRPPSDFVTLISGTTYPNIDHYYRELSNNQIDLVGSNVVGWFTLPQPRSYYVGSSLNFSALTTDCTAAADATVDFSKYYGINMQFNEDLDGSAWGGSRYLTLDGTSKYFGTTWMPLWATRTSRYGVYAHEMGHAFGWPHSSGPYNAVYDSKWDVMSNSYLLYYTPGQSYVAGHTIVRNKDAAGWIPISRKITVQGGSSQNITLDSHEFPSASTGTLMVQIPITGTGNYYTVESRLQQGYDTPLPAAAVIIHKITSGYARVVDPDNNNDPNDASAQWTTGEIFTDVTANISVEINAKTATGWDIKVTNNSFLCTVTLSAAANGTAAITSGGATGSCGRTVTVQGNPNAGFGFVNFAEDGAPVSTSNPYTFVLSKDRTIVANFGTAQCTVTLNQASGGSAILTSGSAVGTCGRTVTVQATPAANFVFGGWSDGSVLNPYPLIVSANRTLAPTFTVSQCALTLTAGAGGTASIASGGATGNCGRSVTIQAIANANFGFSDFSEGGTLVSVASPYTFVLGGNRAIVANFVASQCTLALSAGNGGSVSLVSGATAGACGRSITVQATPDAFSTFTAWSDGSTVNPRTFTIATSLTLSATFTSRQCTLTVTAGTGGTVSVSSGGTTGNCGRLVTIDATAGSGYGFASFTESGNPVSSSNPFTFALNTDRIFVGNFFVSQCTLTLSASSGGGTVSVENGTPAGACGRSITVQGTPNTNFAFGTWSDGTSINPYTFTLNSNRTLSATFTSLQCSLLVNASSGGSATIVVGTGGGLCGRSVTLQATPDRNYAFVNFTENGAVVSLQNPFTTNMNGNRALVANFAIAQCSLFIAESEGGSAAVVGGNETGNCGRTITVKATATTNYVFSAWTDATKVNPYTFELSTNIALAPQFSPVLCTLTLNNVAGGTAAITSGGASGQCGRSVTVSATPVANSTFTSWSNGATVNPQTFALNRDLTLSPNYAGVLCTLTLGTVPNGTISIASGNVAGACGRSITLIAAPNANYEFARWSNGTTSNPYVLSLTGDLTLSANFSALQCTLTLNSTAGGTTAVSSGAVTGDCGRSITVQATPAPNFAFLNWTDSGAELSRAPVYSVTVSRNVTMTGNFQTAINVQDIANRLMSGFVSGTLTFSSAERQYIDSQGNSNGSVDLGDLLALVQKNPSITAGPDALLKIMSNPKASTVRIPVANNKQP